MTWDHGSAIRSFKVHGSAIRTYSACKYLRAWFDLHSLWTKFLCYIFSNAAISGRDKTVIILFNQCISKKWYERRLDAMLHNPPGRW